MDKALHDEIVKKLIDEGKLIEAGFIGFRFACIPPTAGEAQVTDMRVAFLAGAQHLFSSLIAVLDAGAEPTEKDLDRMSLIDKELREFADQLTQQVRARGTTQ